MKMTVLAMCALVHAVSVVLLTITAPRVLLGTDPGIMLFWAVGAVSVVLGMRAALSILLLLAARACDSVGVSARTLSSTAVRIAPQALRAAVTTAVAGGLGLGAAVAPAHAGGAETRPASAAAGPAQVDAPLAWPITGRAGEGVRPGSAPAHHVVAEGESLWSIASAADPEADISSTALRVEDIHAANREVIGSDPSLIVPGQRLELP